MSTTPKPEDASPPACQRRGPGGGGPFGGMQGPAEKAMNFGPSAKRLVGRLAPERWRVIFVTILGVVSVIVRRARPEDPRRGDQHHRRRGDLQADARRG